jgi:hypothetical protein
VFVSLVVAAACSTSRPESSKSQDLTGNCGYGGCGSNGSDRDGGPGSDGGGPGDGPTEGGPGDDGGTDGGGPPNDGGTDDGGNGSGSGSGSGSGDGSGSGSGSGSGDGSGSGSGDGSGSGSGDGSGSGSGDGSGSGSGDGSGSGGGSGSNGCGSDSGSNSGGCGSGDGSGSGSGGGSGGGSGSGGGGGGSDCDYYPEDCGGGGGGSGSGSGSGSCDAPTDEPRDVCRMLADDEVTSDDVNQWTLDKCDCEQPVQPDCVFTPIPYFYGWDWGCNVYDPDEYGDLGNFSEMCPTDVYQAQDLCAFAKTGVPPEEPLDPDYWVQASDGDEDTDEDLWVPYDYPEPFDDGIDPMTNIFGYIGSVFTLVGDVAPNDYATFQQQGPKVESDTDVMRFNQFGPENGSSGRNVVVLGSSMMSTHNQVKNGKMCSRASTMADNLPPRQGRGLIGNDFTASPAWKTRVAWNKALALGRTGYNSQNVLGAGVGTPDACGNPWTSTTHPADLGLKWFQKEVGIDSNSLMITDGGLINEQQTVDDAGWSETLAGIVLCQAMDKAVAPINQALAEAHAFENEFEVILKGNDFVLDPPTVTLERWTPTGRWADALDLPKGSPKAVCRYRVKKGNGLNPNLMEEVAKYPHKTVSSLKRLWTGGPADSPVLSTLQRIVKLYSDAKVKQIWLQYPSMEFAQVTVTGHDLAIFLPEGVSNFLETHLGLGAVTLNSIDQGLRPRIRQVSDDLNELMYNALGCNQVAAYAANHPAVVCKRDPMTNAPLVVVTSNNYQALGWGPNDHQRTIQGGMPHESATGADKMGTLIRDADALP